MTDGGDTRLWQFRSRQNSHQFEGRLVAYWEVELDPISDDYTPNEISAEDLLGRWAGRVGPKFSNGLVPIHWFIESPGQGVFELMPFQFEHYPGQREEDFLARFTWPVDSRTGERLNWLTLPVVDKLWNRGRRRRVARGGHSWAVISLERSSITGTSKRTSFCLLSLRD